MNPCHGHVGARLPLPPAPWGAPCSPAGRGVGQAGGEEPAGGDPTHPAGSSDDEKKKCELCADGWVPREKDAVAGWDCRSKDGQDMERFPGGEWTTSDSDRSQCQEKGGNLMAHTCGEVAAWRRHHYRWLDQAHDQATGD